MFKKVSIAIIAILSLACIYFVYYGKTLNKEVKDLRESVSNCKENSKKDVPSNEKKEDSFKELLEDIESIKKDGKIIHAKVNSDSKENYTNYTYYGNDYYIEEWHGGEVISYIVYYKNEKVWTYDKVFPLERIE